MASNRGRRIAKEILDIRADTISHITVDPMGDDEDITHLRGSFPGPPGTPYEGGTYAIDIRIPTDYPFRPPKMKFVTKVWHPNVSSQTVSSLGHTRIIRPYSHKLMMITGRHLPGYSRVGVVAGPHHQVRPAVATVVIEHARAEGSAGCGGCDNAHRAA